MSVWFVIVVPLVVLVFALFMERVERRLRAVAARQNEVEQVRQPRVTVTRPAMVGIAKRRHAKSGASA